MTDLNLLKIKSESGKKYIFDALSNNIYEIDPENDLESIELKDIGYSSDIRSNSLTFKDMHKSVTENAKTLIIELTESCNIRCTYCVFDESDNTERNHSDKSISEETALQSIDDFFKRTNGEEGYLVFYGGEPLLSFPLMQKMVNHSNVISDKKIKFSFTTNGISLTNEKFNFLIENDFKITVSIDGPKVIHDKRRLTKNGKGTFSIIEKNLMNLKKINIKFFDENVNFNCTISDFDDVNHINDFFKGSTLFKKENVRFAPVIENSFELDKKISLSISNDELKSSLTNKKPVFLKSSINLDINSINPVQDAFMGDIIRKIKHRELDDSAINGKKICIPFSNRTYIRASGEIQFCERIQKYEISKSIYNIEYLSKKIYDEFHAFKADSCSKCFAYNFCEMCPASFILNGSFNEDISVKKCSEYRKNVERAMQVYINSMEAQEES